MLERHRVQIIPQSCLPARVGIELSPGFPRIRGCPEHRHFDASAGHRFG